MSKRHITRNRVSYTLTFDEYNVLDTVTKKGSEELLSNKNKDVKFFVTHADEIFSFKKVNGIEYDR